MGNSKVVLLLILCTYIAHDVSAQSRGWRSMLPWNTTNKRPKTSKASTCTIKIQGNDSDLNERSPLLLNKSSSLDNIQFILPSANTDILEIQHGEEITLACPGKNPQEMQATCIGGKTFNVDGYQKAFSTVKCNKTPKSSILKDGICGTKNKTYIGFQLQNNSFLKMIEICYDNDALKPIYSKFNLSRGILNCQKVNKSCSYFLNEPYNDKLPKDFYKCVKQKSTFQDLIGKNNYINCDTGNKSLLAKGHLAAFADFVYYAQRKATMYYINTVPQWQKFNTANWKVLENKIRSYAAANGTGVNLTIYTGGYKVLKLSGEEKENVSIFLGKKTNGTKLVVPVPEQIYKIVCDVNKTQGMVFIGINRVNWDGTTFNDSNYRICENECFKTDLYSGNVDPAKGYIYCCTLPEFMKNKELAKYFPAYLKNYKPLKRK